MFIFRKPYEVENLSADLSIGGIYVCVYFLVAVIILYSLLSFVIIGPPIEYSFTLKSMHRKNELLI